MSSSSLGYGQPVVTRPEWNVVCSVLNCDNCGCIEAVCESLLHVLLCHEEHGVDLRSRPVWTEYQDSVPTIIIERLLAS